MNLKTAECTAGCGPVLAIYLLVILLKAFGLIGMNWALVLTSIIWGPFAITAICLFLMLAFAGAFVAFAKLEDEK